MKQIETWEHCDKDKTYKAIMTRMRKIYNFWRKQQPNPKNEKTWHEWAHERSLYYFMRVNLDLFRDEDDTAILAVMNNMSFSRDKFLKGDYD